MCGITGFIEQTGPAEPAILYHQLASLRHRGPDGEGLFCHEHVALGMRRLAIIDLVSGDQPMYSRDGSFVLVFNGEIYNFRALRRELEAAGQTFDTNSDTEVILRGIEHWGIQACVDQLNGMFAFALWNRATQTLTLVRDRLGIKPLYIYHDSQRIVFASEIKAILHHPAVPRQIDPRGLANFLAFGHALAPQTMLQGIQKLPPAHTATWTQSSGTLQIRRYWQPELMPQIQISESEAAAECYERLREAVRLQLVSDVPLGAFLSGGLDSSIIVGLMAQLGVQPIRTFSVGFAADQAFNELDDARLVAQHFGTEHHELIIQPHDLANALETLVYHYDEPFGDAAALPLYLIAKFARQHVTVALTGVGSDEQWVGYRRYQAEQLATLYQRLPARSMIHDLIQRLPRSRRLKQAVKAFNVSDPARRYAAWLTIAHASQRQRLLHPDLLGQLHEHEPEQIYDEAYPPNGVPLQTKLGYTDLLTWLPDTYLEKVDKATMAASLEARVPFLDHTLVEWTMRLPPSMKLRGTTTKWLLRQTFADMLPQRTIKKPKHGFAVPTDPWFRGELRDWTAQVLFDQRTLQRGLFNQAEVERIYAEHQRGRHVHDTLLWLLLNLELWQRLYLDAAVTA